MLNSISSESPVILDNFSEDLSLLHYSYFYSALALAGVFANTVNIFVFSLMDLGDATNISLLGLSICDFFSLLCSFLMNISNLAFSVPDFGPITFGKAYFCIKRISNWIIAFITCERCLCIVQPMKVHDIITPRRSVVILFVIGVTMTATVSPSFISAYYQFNLNIAANKTLFLSVYTGIVLTMESISTSISFFLNILTLVWVTLCTIILVLNLKQSSKWRLGTSGKMASDKISSRDKQVIKMVTLLLTIFIVSFVPECLVLFAQAVERELSLFGTYRHLQTIFLFTTETLYLLNASVNIFVYLDFL